MASCDYLAWFDDDEILDGPLKPWLADRPDVLWIRRTDVWESTSIKCEFRDRVYAKGINPCWHSPVHEWANYPGHARRSVARPDVTRVIHHPRDIAGRHNHRAHVERAFAKQPTRHLAFYLAMFDYAEAAHGVGDWATAAHALRAVTEMPPDPHRPHGGVQEVETAFRWLSVCLDQLGDGFGAWFAEASADGVASVLVEERRETAELDRRFPLEYDPLVNQLIASGTYSATGTYRPTAASKAA
jgi:hypothetical protein